MNYGVIFAPIPIDNAMDDDRKEELIVVTIYRNKNKTPEHKVPRLFLKKELARKRSAWGEFNSDPPVSKKKGRRKKKRNYGVE